MATVPVTIYGKVECYSNYRGALLSTYKNQLAGDYYTSLYKFLQTLSGSGITELVTANTGSNGNGVGYWNETTHFGDGCFSVWKFKPNGERTWEWYLYIHTNSGSSAGSFEQTTAQTPTKLLGSATTDGATFRSVIASAAICVSTSLTGSTNINPWNGTFSTTSATKGSTVWVTGASTANKLFAFPRQNAISGSSVTNKDNNFAIARYGDSLPTAEHRWHFMSDGHGIIMVQDYLTSTVRYPRNQQISYFGPYRMTPAISKSNPGNVLSGTGSLGFLCFKSQQQGAIAPNTGNTSGYASHAIPEYQTIGQLAYSTTIFDGGLMATLDKDVRTFRLTNDYGVGLAYPQNPNIYLRNKITEKPYSVLAHGETGFQGMLGILDTVLIRSVGNGFLPHDTSTTTQRTIFGSNIDVGTRMISTPWPSGSMPPGSLQYQEDGIQRDGISFTIANYTI